jgi:hypothetical protein
VGDERAAEVVEGWVRFMELKPFGEDVDGEVWGLKGEWRRRLVDVARDCEEGDGWLRWLEKYAPATASEVDVAVAEIPAPETAAEEEEVEEEMGENVEEDEEEEMEGEMEYEMEDEVAIVADFIRPTTHEDVPPPFQQPTSPTETHVAHLYATSTPPYLASTTSELLHPNLVTRFLFHALQLFFFLTIVGNISCQQFASLAILGFVTLAARRNHGVTMSENGKCDVGALRGVWYPDLTERLAEMDGMGMAETVRRLAVY